MKKVLSLSLMALATLTVGAQTAYQLVDKKATPFQKVAKLNEVKRNAPARVAAQVTDVVGDYEMSYYVQLQGSGGAYEYEMTVTAGTSANQVIFNIPFENSNQTLEWNVVGTLNTATGEITISKNQDSGYPGATVGMQHWNGQAYQEISEIKATYNGSNIVFDPDDGMGLQAASGGWYTFFDTIEMTKIIDDPNFDPNEGWTKIGEAVLMDGWVSTCYGIDQFENTYNVEAQRNNANPNIYRLVNPFKGNCPAAQYNQSTKTGYIQFDVTNPDLVIFDGVEAGFANSTQGISKFYALNSAGFAKGYLSLTNDSEIIQFLDQYDMPKTTFVNGVVDLTSTMGSDGTWNNDATFGIQGDIYGGYVWQDSNEKPINMAAKIILPEVNAVNEIATDNNAPVEYYNLQGMRVVNPEKGQVVIARQGNKASKYVVK